MFRELDFIERKNGYLDLNSYLIEKYGTVSIKLISKTNDIIKDDNFYWLNIDEKKVTTLENNKDSNKNY